MPEDTVTISREEYEQLKEESREIRALWAGGVDNWEYYYESINSYEEE